jgi:hypothetical protein
MLATASAVRQRPVVHSTVERVAVGGHARGVWVEDTFVVVGGCRSLEYLVAIFVRLALMHIELSRRVFVSFWGRE